MVICMNDLPTTTRRDVTPSPTHAEPKPDPAQGRREGRARLAAEDRRLMARMAAREERALEALYERYSGMVLAVGLRILRNRADAEEVLVDTFFEVWSKPDRYDASRGTVIGYLMLTARSRAIDRLRARRPDEGRPDPTETGAGAAGGPTPAEEGVMAEVRGEVRRALESLASEQREAIELAYFEGLSHSQVAQRLGIPLGTAKTRIRQGFIHLRNRFRRSISGTNES